MAKPVRSAQSYIKKVETSGKSLEALISEVDAYGWIINNLFQVGNPKFWRCNVAHINGKTGKITSEYADGHTAEEAVAAALFDIKQDRNKHTLSFASGRSISHSDLYGDAALESKMMTPIPLHARKGLEKAIADLTDALNTYWPEFNDDGSLSFFLSF